MTLQKNQSKSHLPQNDQQKQMTLGLKLKELIKAEVGSSFHNKWEGGGPVVIIKFVTGRSNTKLISEIKDYLKTTFGIITEDKFSENHGGGNKATILINLSQLPEEVIKKIEEEYVSKNLGKKKKIVPAKKIEVIEEVVVVVPEKIEPEPEIKRRGMNIASKNRMSMTAFLFGVYEFENNFLESKQDFKQFFSYQSNINDEMQIILCKDELTAIRIEIALKWLTGNPTLVVRSESEIMVNFSEREKKPVGVTFCLPPSIGTQTDEMKARLHRVSPGSFATVIPLTNYVYRINYVKRTTSSKILSIITKMGWTAKLSENDGLDVILVDINSNHLTKQIQKQDTLVKEVLPNVVPVIELAEICLTKDGDQVVIEKSDVIVSTVAGPILELVEAVQTAIPGPGEANQSSVSLYVESHTPHVIVEKSDVIVPADIVAELIPDKEEVSSKPEIEKIDIPAVESTETVVVTPVVSLFDYSEEEALFEMNKLFSDEKKFSKLSPEIQADIYSTLRRISMANLAEEHPDDYAKLLLSCIKK